MSLKKHQVFIHKKDHKIIGKLVEEGFYDNPSQCIRDILRNYLNYHAKNLRSGPAGVEMK